MGRRDLLVGLVMAPYHEVALNGKKNIAMYIGIMTLFDNGTVTTVILT